MTTWVEHVNRWKGCQRCPLGQQRDRICLARSGWPPDRVIPYLHLPCDIVFVGEAPGTVEDTSGLPFTGPAGEHPTCGLNVIIEQALENLPVKLTYSITNLVACFPRTAKSEGNHQPERGEILECRTRLVEFMNMAQPRLIVRVGKLCTSYLGFDSTVPMVDIDHPAYVLRMPLAQRQMATQNSVVTIRSAIEDMLQLSMTKQQWKPWGVKHVEEKQDYDFGTPYGFGAGTDNIPF